MAMMRELPTRARRYVADVAAIAALDMRKLRHDPTELLTRAIQPMLWLLVFGQVFAHARNIPTGGIDYLAFLAPGILAQSVLFVAIFNGISVIWERDLGIVHKFLVSPAARSALVLGKALAAGVRALTQAVIVYALAAALGVRLAVGPSTLVSMVALVLLGAGLFSTFSLIVACVVKTRERFMGIGQVLTMPLFFASNAIYPTELMPGWLRALAHANPLSYLVDGLRGVMLAGGASTLGLGRDVMVLAGGMAILVAVGGRMYPRLIT
ncbi:MAG TPA: ABC transporter permease [Ideonella sp.]|nr:ABC transporter permease [Ideonella sp.]